jgi:hypothetical protein
MCFRRNELSGVQHVHSPLPHPMHNDPLSTSPLIPMASIAVLSTACHRCWANWKEEEKPKKSNRMRASTRNVPGAYTSSVALHRRTSLTNPCPRFKEVLDARRRYEAANRTVSSKDRRITLALPGGAESRMGYTSVLTKLHHLSVSRRSIASISETWR